VGAGTMTGPTTPCPLLTQGGDSFSCFLGACQPTGMSNRYEFASVRRDAQASAPSTAILGASYFREPEDCSNWVISPQRLGQPYRSPAIATRSLN